MITYIKKAFGNPQEKTLRKYYKVLQKVNELESEINSLTDEQLKEKTVEFKEKLSNGASIDDIKTEAFAVVREASKRVLGMRHFDVQIIGGLALLDGNIAEMATGEGKTLVASLPSYLRALEGKGVHVITVNEYLAQRDREINGQIHEFLGLTVGLNIGQTSPGEKRAAYNADITYGVGTEFGFDYLRDHMVGQAGERVQRPYHYAIVDEVDSVLIDEAKTPLIIAGKTSLNSELFFVTAQLVKRFKIDVDYTFDPETKATNFTEEGINKVEKAFAIDNLYDLEHQTLYHYMIQSLRAQVIFKRDVDYIVKEGKVELVDMFTGRIMEGRSLSDGLHQAIEAKEGLVLTDENKMQATVTVQNYFRMYPILAGMTGTAKTEEKEFQDIYGMDVISVPPNKTRIREDLTDIVFETTDQKYEAVVREVKSRHAKGQPVLIGTTSILQSEAVANYLDKEKLEYELLNAKSVEKEVELISLAGQKGQITIATNMAGRGTDILLGEGVAELGGLHVIGTERHESRRIDNQLKGRAGRQGDPGSSQFFISVEDELVRRFAQEHLEKMEKKWKTDTDGRILNKDVVEFFDRVQRICEGANFSAREYTLKLDDIVNEQRTIIYKMRNNLLESENPMDNIIPMFQSLGKHYVELYCPEDQDPETWKLETLTEKINAVSLEQMELLNHEDIRNQKEVLAAAEKPLEETVRQLEEAIGDYPNIPVQLGGHLLRILDGHWIQHLESMTRLKEGIGLRGYSQEDPIRQYQREGLEIFTFTYYEIEEDACRLTVQLLQHYAQLKTDNE